jgi:dTDP-4-dehydrorhamnose reductase
MNILILGATGMLGHKMFQTLRERFPDTCAALRGAVGESPYTQVDLFRYGNVVERVNLEDLDALSLMLCKMEPHVIVNCAGIIKQRPEAQATIPSVAINAFLPHHLAALCAQWGGRLIHFSTDCVFSGRQGNYAEDDQSDAEDLYGKTKYLGEVMTENALTLRTSMIGRELAHFHSLLEWFLRQNQGCVNGFTQAIYSGVTTNYLAEVVSHLIENYPTLSGLYQLTGQPISKYDLLCLLREAYRLDIEIVPDESFRCDRSMKCDKFRRATGIEAPPWPELVAQLANDSTPYEEWREKRWSYLTANAS